MSISPDFYMLRPRGDLHVRCVCTGSREGKNGPLNEERIQLRIFQAKGPSLLHVVNKAIAPCTGLAAFSALMGRELSPE